MDDEKLVSHLKGEHADFDRRLERLEKSTAAVQELTTAVKLLAQNMEHMAKEQADQGQRLKALEAEPAQRWNNMTRTIFTSVLSTLTGGMLGAILALVLR